jgi:hypothetical protein
VREGMRVGLQVESTGGDCGLKVSDQDEEEEEE